MQTGGAPRLPVVGVLGSSIAEHRELAEPLGAWLAAEGVHLLTGAGAGVMTAVSRAFSELESRRGMVIGIVPGSSEDHRYAPRAGYPNRWVEIAIYTHLPLSGTRGEEPMSRNHINVLSADVIVALPGGEGTACETRLALRYGRPVIAFVGSRTDIPGLPDEIVASGDLQEICEFVRKSVGVVTISVAGTGVKSRVDIASG